MYFVGNHANVVGQWFGHFPLSNLSFPINREKHTKTMFFVNPLLTGNSRNRLKNVRTIGGSEAEIVVFYDWILGTKAFSSITKAYFVACIELFALTYKRANVPDERLWKRPEIRTMPDARTDLHQQQPASIGARFQSPLNLAC